jgi:predicted SnoaL-like aldol condensation-catalyzing enzyme
MKAKNIKNRNAVATSLIYPFIALVLLLGGCSKVSEPEQVQERVQESPEILAQQYLQALYSANYADAISNYLGSNYVEHQVSAGFSRSGLGGYVQQRLADNPDHQLVIHRVIAQNDYVFLHVEERLNSEEAFSRAEWFRFENGKIVEHWAGVQAAPKDTASGNSMFDGTAVNKDSTAGARYTQRMEDAYRGFIGELNPDVARDSVIDGYTQHNPGIADGKEGLVSFVNMMKEEVDYITVDYKMTVADGDFVALHSYIDAPPLFSEINVFDIFRITEDGLLAEHWDIIEPVQSKDDLEKMFVL